jgi:DNA-binding response OmpR family regulator
MTDRILVVDDDPQITTLLSRYLSDQGFDPVCAASGMEMRDALKSRSIDLCVLDIGLPDADGFALTREIRADSNMPIIVLSVRNETFDRIVGLEFGADDYVTKPFEPRELVARIRSVLRRTRAGRLAEHSDDSTESVMRFGDWEMNPSQRTLMHVERRELAYLTSMEFDILRALADKPRVVLSRDQLLTLARGDGAIVGDRAIDVHIMRLRKKIEEDPANPVLVKTIHGIGYTLADHVTWLTPPAR